MRIMAKLITAMNGRVRESAEVVIDANSLRIFAQEIHESENHITQSKHQLASIMAEKIRVNREVGMLETSIDQLEQRMADYLKNDNEVAALKLAQTVSDKDALLKRQLQHHTQLEKHEDQLQQTLQKTISKLDNYKTELRMAKATGRMQSAQSQLACHSNNAVSRFGDMEDSLSRIQERQQAFSDEMNAMDQLNAKLSGDFVENINETLKDSAKDVLDRVKRKSSIA